MPTRGGGGRALASGRLAGRRAGLRRDARMELAQAVGLRTFPEEAAERPEERATALEAHQVGNVAHLSPRVGAQQAGGLLHAPLDDQIMYGAACLGAETSLQVPSRHP